MDVTISGENEDFVAVDTECRLLDALIELVDPQRFAGEGVEAVEERCVPRTDVDAVAGNRRCGKPAAVGEGPEDLGGFGIDAIHAGCGWYSPKADTDARCIVGAVLKEGGGGVEVREVPGVLWILVSFAQDLPGFCVETHVDVRMVRNVNFTLVGDQGS